MSFNCTEGCTGFIIIEYTFLHHVLLYHWASGETILTIKNAHTAWCMLYINPVVFNTVLNGMTIECLDRLIDLWGTHVKMLQKACFHVTKVVHYAVTQIRTFINSFKLLLIRDIMAIHWFNRLPQSKNSSHFHNEKLKQCYKVIFYSDIISSIYDISDL